MIARRTAELTRDEAPLEAGADRPFALNAGDVWLVESGRIDVFLTRFENGAPAGPRTHVCRIAAGQAIFGFDAAAWVPGMAIHAVGSPGTHVYRLAADDVRRAAVDPVRHAEIAQLVDGWIGGICEALSRAVMPKGSAEIRAGQRIAVDRQCSVHLQSGVAWVRHVAGSSLFLGHRGSRIDEGEAVPLVRRAWLTAHEDATFMVVDTATMLQGGEAWSGLETFHRVTVQSVEALLAREMKAEHSRLARRTAASQARLAQAFDEIAATLDPRPATATAMAIADATHEDALFSACRLVGAALHLTVKRPPERAGQVSRDPLGAIAKASRFRTRRVMLHDRWWRQDNGPLVGKMTEDKRPVALLPKGSTSYLLHDPLRGTHDIVTDDVARSLEPHAHAFYRPFAGSALDWRTLVRFGLQGCRADLIAIALTNAACGTLGLLVPYATGLVFTSIIPGAQRDQLLQLTLILLACALACGMCQISSTVALLRIDGRMGGSIQAALWDRLLSLPTTFFRLYSSGDLAVRAMGIDAMRQILSGSALTAVLSGVFSLFNLGLLYYYDVRLAEWATALLAIAIVALIVVSRAQLGLQRAVSPLRSRTSGLVLQFLTGISKVRVAAAESQAFALWARLFTRQRQLQFRARTISNHFAVFRAAYPILSLMVLFWAVTHPGTGDPTLRAGDLLAFLAAFTASLTAILVTGSSVIGMLPVVSHYELLRPILHAVPEVDEAKSDPGVLSGKVDVDHLVFRYQPDGPPTLQDVSVRMNPGEFVAFVGPSGSGKSTLMRLLLGFERPERGSIYFDGQDLDGLDVAAVRRQIGVVLQNGRLMSGDLYTNIVGSSVGTLDDAWEAARMAGLDEDIKRMPMGMHTVVSEGGGTLSGGQRQRLLIARAILGRPRLLFFDEATSALDNRTQAIVTESLDRLQATRVVVAHRLTTIAKADRIYVMDRGRIVQTGTFAELLAQDGLFKELAGRQLV